MDALPPTDFWLPLLPNTPLLSLTGICRQPVVSPQENGFRGSTKLLEVAKKIHPSELVSSCGAERSPHRSPSNPSVLRAQTLSRRELFRAPLVAVQRCQAGEEITIVALRIRAKWKPSTAGAVPNPHEPAGSMTEHQENENILGSLQKRKGQKLASFEFFSLKMDSGGKFDLTGSITLCARDRIGYMEPAIVSQR